MKQYWKEICILLVVKSILLTVLWYFCFRNPIELDDQTTAEHVFITSGESNHGSVD